jgi:hypothetical protein
LKRLGVSSSFICLTWSFATRSLTWYTRKNWENEQLVPGWYQQAWTRLCMRPTMNSIVNMLLQHCSTVTTWNNMVDNLFIGGRTTLFTSVDINLQQPVRF